MDAINTLLNQYSFADIIILLITIGIAIKFIGDLWEWFSSRIRKRFNLQSDQQKWQDKIEASIADIKKDTEKFQSQIEDVRYDISMLGEQQENTTERLQENTRSFIIDKHHYFCYKVKAIDDINLQSLERRYMYYKTAGGDSFIDDLMDEIRELPKVNLQQRYAEIGMRGIEDPDKDVIL